MLVTIGVKMYYINKIVGWVASPLGFLFLGLGVAWVIGLKWGRSGSEGSKGEQARNGLAGRLEAKGRLGPIGPRAGLRGERAERGESKPDGACGQVEAMGSEGSEGSSAMVSPSTGQRGERAESGESKPDGACGQVEAERARRIAKGVVGVVLGVVWCLGSGWMTWIVGVPLERMSGSGCVVEMEKLPEADAIVLLGGGMGYHEKCGSPEMFSSADRVWMAARLWKAGKAKRITLSGGGSEKSTKPLLREFGVDESACVCFEDARNTEEESHCIKELGINKILLVTSAWHMPRARMMFERRGFEVIPCPTDFEASYAWERDVEIGDLFPNAESLWRNAYFIKEWVGLLGYKVLGR